MKTLLKKKNMSIKYNSLHIKTRYTLKIHVTTQQKQLKHSIHTYKRYFIIIPVDLYNLISNVYNKDFIYLTKKDKILRITSKNIDTNDNTDNTRCVKIGKACNYPDKTESYVYSITIPRYLINLDNIPDKKLYLIFIVNISIRKDKYSMFLRLPK